MGLVGWVKGVVIRREASKAGARFAERGGAVIDFLKRNKATVGVIFAAVAAWGSVHGCPPVVGIDILNALHLSCTQANVIIGVLGAFLGGAGLVTSDKHEAVIQGVVAPAGPPSVLPPAEVKRLKEESKG